MDEKTWTINMNIKNALIFTLITIIGGLSQLVCLVVYPIAFLFRSRILKYATDRFEEDETNYIFRLKPGVEKWKLYISPLFWGFLFTTGFTDKYAGPSWFKKELKLKWRWPYDKNNDVFYFSPNTLKQRLQYVWLSYLWGGIRNAGWAFSEWFFREGKPPYQTIKIHRCSMLDKNIDPIADLEIMPCAKFKDKDGTNRDNSGPYIRYPFDSNEKWLVTNEGVKILTFKTLVGNERFEYAKTKIYKCGWINKFLVVSLFLGWHWWDGMKIIHIKFMFKRMDDFQLSEYSRYQEYLKA